MRQAKEHVVIYHADCLDGFCAAWIMWRYFGDRADYVPAYYGQEPPNVEGKHVHVVDFSYPYDTTLRMIDQAESYVVLDHHKTAEDALGKVMDSGVGCGKARIVFDMHRSGAGLARDNYALGLDSWLVDYTQDRDLWRFALPRSKQVNAYIGTLEQTFAAYEEAHTTLTAEQAADLGIGADAYKTMYVAKLVKHARRVRFAGHADIPIVNAPYVGISEVVGALAEDAQFAVGWFHRGDGKVAFSLRSRGEFDVSELAKAYGGGGHAKAAGFTVESSAAVGELIRGEVP